MSKLAYTSGPAGWWPEVREEVELDLHALGFDIYRPDLAFTTGPRSAAVHNANLAVMGQCQAGVVYVPEHASLAMSQPVEVEHLMGKGVPVMVVTDARSHPTVDSWRQLGAVVSDLSDTTEGMLALAHLVAERQNRPTIRETVRRLGEAMQAVIPKPRPLTFEAVDDGCEHVLTETGPQHLLPSRGYADDAGLDLYVSADVEIPPHSFVDVPCGVKVDIPAGHWAMITGRSSTLRKRKLLVSTGVIDAGWTGPLFAGVQNLGPDAVHVPAGDRLAQLILLPAPVTALEPEWGRVPRKERGESGFGSTGC